MSFESDYNALKSRTTDRIIEIVLTVADAPKTASNISIINAGMLALLNRVSDATLNDLWTQIEAAGYVAGDEPSAIEEDYIGSPIHY